MSSTQEKLNAILGKSGAQSAATVDPVAAPVTGGRGGSSPVTPPPAGGRGAGGTHASVPAATIDKGPGPGERAVSAVTAVKQDVVQGARDLIPAVVRATQKNVNQLANTSDSIEGWISDKLGVQPTQGWVEFFGKDGLIKWHNEARPGNAFPEEAMPAESKAVTGKVIESAAQLIEGMVGAGKFLKATGIATKLPALANSKLVQGAIADFVFTDTHQKRMADYLTEASPEVLGPYTSFLASGPNDSEAEKRLKNAAEGSLIGMGLDAFMASAGILKNSSLFKNATKEAEKEAAAKKINEYVEALNKAVNEDKNVPFKVVRNEAGEFDIHATLTADQKKAITVNSGVGVDTANTRQASRAMAGEPLRQGISDYQIGDFNNKQIENAKQILTSIADAKPHDAPLYRGLRLSPDTDLYKQIRDGNEINLGVSSFSKDAEVANTFAAGNNGVKVRLELEQGAKAVPVPKGLTPFPDENEVLSSGKFQIVSKNVDPETGDIDALIKQVPSATTDSLATKYPKTFATQAEAEQEAAALNAWHSYNTKAATVAQAPGKLTDEQINTIKAQAAHLNDPDNPYMAQTNGTDFNFNYIRGEEEAKTWFESISTTLRKQMDAARGGAKVTHEELISTVKKAFPLEDPDQLIAALSRDVKPEDIPAHVLAGRIAMNDLGKAASQLSKELDANPNNMIAATRLTDTLDRLFSVTSITKGRITSAARTVESQKINVTDVTDALKKTGRQGAQAAPKTATEAVTNLLSEQGLLMQKLKTAIPNMTNEQVQGFARKLRIADGDPEVIFKMLKPFEKVSPGQLQDQAFVSRVLDKTTQVWMNAVLSGPLTTMQNVMGNVTGLLVPASEKMFAGVLRAPFSPKAGLQQMAEGADLLAGYVTNLGDSWRAMRKSFAVNSGIIDPGHGTQEFGSIFQGTLGSLGNIPSKFLMGQDEFFKNLGYRSFVRAQALKEAKEAGMSAAQAASHVNNMIEASLEDGKAIYQGLGKQALDFAREGTYSTPLQEGTWSKSLLNLVNDHPSLRLMALPFVTTPSNLVRFSWERTPVLGLWSRNNKAALQAGGAQAAEVWAKQATGLMTFGTAAYLAHTGVITGNGPSDPELRRQWQDAGFKPYSVRVGDRWYSYRRGDPVLFPFGIVADMAQSSGEIAKEEVDKWPIAFATAMTRNISSKSYMYGLTQFMDAVSGGDQAALKAYLESKPASFVPSLLNQTNPDEGMREMRGYMDKIIGRIPGMSDVLPPRRNIFGEPVMKDPGYLNNTLNPFTRSAPIVSDSVQQRLLEFGKAIPFPAKVYPGTNVDLTSRQWGTTKKGATPYDRMMELMASPGDGMPTLRTAVTDLVTSKGFDQLSPGVPGVQEGGTQFDKVNERVQKYRDIAMKKMRLEFPELDTAIEQSRLGKKAARRGGPDGLRQILDYFKQR